MKKNQYMCAPDQVHPNNPHVWKINACVREYALPEIAMHLSTKATLKLLSHQSKSKIGFNLGKFEFPAKITNKNVITKRNKKYLLCPFWRKQLKISFGKKSKQMKKREKCRVKNVKPWIISAILRKICFIKSHQNLVVHFLKPASQISHKYVSRS